MLDYLSLSIIVAIAGLTYTLSQVIKAVVEIRRGRSTGWLKVIFGILEVPDSEPLRRLSPYPSGFILVENRGPFEESISSLHYSITGSTLVEVQCYRQMFGRAIDKLIGESPEQQRFDEAIEEAERHKRRRAEAILGVGAMDLDQWQIQNDAIRQEVKNAHEAFERKPDDSVVIRYPINIPPGGTKRIDFDIPEQWESNLSSVTCLTVRTAKEVLHVKRSYARPSSPCHRPECRSNDH